MDQAEDQLKVKFDFYGPPLMHNGSPTKNNNFEPTMMNTIVKTVVNDLMQQGYSYEFVEAPDANFDDQFQPQLTPKQMLAMDVFGGKYMTDCRDEFPAGWFKRAKLSPGCHDAHLNFFQVRASKSLSYWR